MRGLAVLDIVLVSTLEFTVVDSFSDVYSSASTSRASTSIVGSLMLSLSPSSAIENVALASEYSKVLHFWLLSIPNFICGLLRSCSKVYSIANVT